MNFYRWRERPVSSLLLPILVGLVVILGLVLFTHSDMVMAQLNEWKLIPQPEHFTELYFDNASALPTLTSKGVEASFSFTIHNVEGATTAYPYRVYFEYPSGYRVAFTAGTVLLADNASTTITVSHTFRSTDEVGKVVVMLTSLNQSIDFLVPDSN